LVAPPPSEGGTGIAAWGLGESSWSTWSTWMTPADAREHPMNLVPTVSGS